VTVLRSRSEFINFPKLWWGDASIKNDVAYLLLLVRSSHVQQLKFYCTSSLSRVVMQENA